VLQDVDINLAIAWSQSDRLVQCYRSWR